MTQWVFISASVSVLLVSGCMVGPKYTKPDTPLAPEFKETSEPQAGDGWKVAQPSDGVLRKKWWQTYDDAKRHHASELRGRCCPPDPLLLPMRSAQLARSHSRYREIWAPLAP